MSSETTARLNAVASYITLSSVVYYASAIVLLHVLRTDFDPGYRYLSEYARGPYGGRPSGQTGGQQVYVAIVCLFLLQRRATGLRHQLMKRGARNVVTVPAERSAVGHLRQGSRPQHLCSHSRRCDAC